MSTLSHPARTVHPDFTADCCDDLETLPVKIALHALSWRSDAISYGGGIHRPVSDPYIAHRTVTVDVGEMDAEHIPTSATLELQGVELAVELIDRQGDIASFNVDFA